MAMRSDIQLTAKMTDYSLQNRQFPNNDRQYNGPDSTTNPGHGTTMFGWFVG